MEGDVLYVERMTEPPDYVTINNFTLKNNLLPGLPLITVVTYRHYGIEVGDGTVVHFTGKGDHYTDPCWIQHTALADFLAGGKKEVDLVVDYAFDRRTVVARAFSQVGTDFGGYDFWQNNCEHFAFWCATGQKISRQVFFLADDASVLEKARDRLREPILQLSSALNSTIEQLLP